MCLPDEHASTRTGLGLLRSTRRECVKLALDAGADILLKSEFFSMCMALIPSGRRLTKRLHLLRRSRPAKRATCPMKRLWDSAMDGRDAYHLPVTRWRQKGEGTMNQPTASVRNHCLSPGRAKWQSMHRLARRLMVGCFPNFRRFRPMSNFCTRSVVQAVSAIAETSMTLPTPWVTPRLVGLSSVNLWLTI